MTVIPNPLARRYQASLFDIRVSQMLTVHPAGFGLGALNDADEDDIDIYDTGSSSRRNLIAYEDGDGSRYHHSISRRSGPGSQVNKSSVSLLRHLIIAVIHPVLSPETLSKGSEVENQFWKSLYSQTLQ